MRTVQSRPPDASVSVASHHAIAQHAVDVTMVLMHKLRALAQVPAPHDAVVAGRGHGAVPVARRLGRFPRGATTGATTAAPVCQCRNPRWPSSPATTTTPSAHATSAAPHSSPRSRKAQACPHSADPAHRPSRRRPAGTSRTRRRPPTADRAAMRARPSTLQPGGTRYSCAKAAICAVLCGCAQEQVCPVGSVVLTQPHRTAIKSPLVSRP